MLKEEARDLFSRFTSDAKSAMSVVSAATLVDAHTVLKVEPPELLIAEWSLQLGPAPRPGWRFVAQWIDDHLRVGYVKEGEQRFG